MKKGLSPEAFAKLLDRLGDDPEQAGEKYEELRRVLIRFFEWRGSAFPEEYADECLNRIASKLDEGVEIKNVGAYGHEVARLVFLESLRSRELKNVPLDNVDYEIGTENNTDEADEKERCMRCLDECLATLKPDGRDLITEYYKDNGSSRIDHRQTLAARLGLRRDALGNRAQRIRDKLEQCVKRCLAKNH